MHGSAILCFHPKVVYAEFAATELSGHKRSHQLTCGDLEHRLGLCLGPKVRLQPTGDEEVQDALRVEKPLAVSAAEPVAVVQLRHLLLDCSGGDAHHRAVSVKVVSQLQMRNLPTHTCTP